MSRKRAIPYKVLVERAKAALETSQVTFPYNGTRAAGRRALALARLSGEAVFKVLYRHYAGTATHFALFSGSAAFEGRADKTPYLRAVVAALQKVRAHDARISADAKTASLWRLRSLHALARAALCSHRRELSSRGFACLCACWELARGVRPDQVSRHALEHCQRNGGHPSARTEAALKTLGLSAWVATLCPSTTHEPSRPGKGPAAAGAV